MWLWAKQAVQDSFLYEIQTAVLPEIWRGVLARLLSLNLWCLNNLAITRWRCAPPQLIQSYGAPLRLRLDALCALHS